MNRSREPGVMICPGCATPNEEGRNFCSKCGAPLTWHATTDPMGSVFAEGYAAGRAVSQPHKPIVIVGLWLWIFPLALIFGVLSIVAAIELISGLVALNFEAFFSGLLVTGLCLVVLFFSVSML